MPDYLQTAFDRLGYKTKVSPQYSPHKHVAIKYATTRARQYVKSSDTSPLLNPKETKYIQSVTGTFLYYGRALDSTILPALNEIASKQS